jgi:hypothetical protein
MAAPAERQVDAEFVFDRADDQLLAHVYRLLVPERRGRVSDRRDHDDSCHLCPGVGGTPEGGADDRIADRRVPPGGRAVGA